MHSYIAQFLRYLDIERNASDLTIKSYREDLMDLADYLSDDGTKQVNPETITPSDLRTYVSALHEAGYDRSSIARKLASLRSFYRFAQRQKFASGNPAKPLRNPRAARKLPHFLTADEVKRLLHAPDVTDPAGLRDRAMLETMYSAGLRVSEVVAIKDGDIDMHEGTVRVRGKGRKERIGALGKYAVQAIQAYQRVRTPSARTPIGREHPLFRNKFGDGLTTRSVGRMLENTSRKRDLMAEQRRIPCDIVLRRIFLIVVPTFAVCKNCSGISRLLRPKSTRTYPLRISSKSISQRTRGLTEVYSLLLA